MEAKYYEFHYQHKYLSNTVPKKGRHRNRKQKASYKIEKAVRRAFSARKQRPPTKNSIRYSSTTNNKQTTAKNLLTMY